MSPVSPQLPRKPIRDDYDSEEEIEGRVSEAPLLARGSFEDAVPHSKHAPINETETTWKDRFEAWKERNTGLLLITASQCFFAGMAAGVAFLSQLSTAAVSTSELIATRMAITGLCCHIWLRIHRDPHPFLGPPGIRLLLVLRGVVGFFGLFGVYFALRFLPLSDAVVLTFFAPFVTGVLAALVLKEPYRSIEALAAIVSLGGVVLIAKPTVLFRDEHLQPILVNGKEVTAHQRVVAVLVSLLGCFGAAGAYTTLRLIGNRASPTHSIQYFSVWSTFLACWGPILMPKEQRWFIPTNPMFSVMLIVIGLFGFLGQFLLTMGLTKEKAGRGTLACFSQAPISMLLEKLIFGRSMDMLSFLGASIIMASALTIFLTKTEDQKLPPRLASYHGAAFETTLHDQAASPKLAPTLPARDEEAHVTRD